MNIRSYDFPKSYVRAPTIILYINLIQRNVERTMQSRFHDYIADLLTCYTRWVAALSFHCSPSVQGNH